MDCALPYVASGSDLCKELNSSEALHHLQCPAVSSPQSCPSLGWACYVPHMTKSCLQPNTYPCSEKEIPFILKFQNTPQINTDVPERYHSVFQKALTRGLSLLLAHN